MDRAAENSCPGACISGEFSIFAYKKERIIAHYGAYYCQ